MITRQKRKEIIGRLHRELDIPEGYYRVPAAGGRRPPQLWMKVEPLVEPLMHYERSQAMRTLHEIGVIDEVNERAVMARLVERLDMLLKRDDRKANEESHK